MVSWEEEGKKTEKNGDILILITYTTGHFDNGVGCQESICLHSNVFVFTHHVAHVLHVYVRQQLKRVT